MGWGNKRPKAHKTWMQTDHRRREVHGHLMQMMNRRERCWEAPPCTPADIIANLMSEEAHKAWQTLFTQEPSTVSRCTQLHLMTPHIKIDVLGYETVCHYLILNTPEDTMPTFFGSAVAHIRDVALRAQVLEYIRGRMQRRAEANAMEKVVERIMNSCGTWKQIFRVWPRLVEFLPDVSRQGIMAEVAQAKVQSRYPEDLVHDSTARGDERLYVPYRAHSQRLMEQWLAEAIMLEGSEETEDFGLSANVIG